MSAEPSRLHALNTHPQLFVPMVQRAFAQPVNSLYRILR